MGSIDRAERNIAWIERNCLIPEGKFVGEPVRLRDWQKEIIQGIYGSPTRTVLVSYGRKNAKTTLAGFLCLLHLCGPEARRNSQLISAAQSRDQAALLFSLMAKMIYQSPDMTEALTVRETKKQIICPEIGTQYTAVSADVRTNFGASPVFLVHDELGQVVGPHSPLYEALETACGAHDDPLSIVISTQAPTDADLFSILIDDAKTGADPKKKLFLWEADREMDAWGEEALIAANPAYGDFLNATELQETQAQAKRMPSRESSFRNLHLNQRVNPNDPFVSESVWRDNGLPIRQEDFAKEVVIGLDLSERNDLTALVMTGKGSDGCESVKCYFYAPSEGVSERSHKDRVPYTVWADQGFLTLTTGATVDYEWVARKLLEIDENHKIKAIKFDRWRMKYLEKELERLGAGHLIKVLVEHGQGYASMAPALDALEADLLNCRLRHGNNPILTWNANNAVVVRDAAGNRKLDKSKSTGRIDGLVALAMTRDEFEQAPGPISGGVIFA